jgi:hypothetical protein
MVTIYALKDPDTLDIRYIGQTKEPNGRRHAHASSVRAKHKMNPDYKAWMASLLERETKPVFVVLEEVDETQANATEDKYIFQCIREGNGNLTNRRNSVNAKLPTKADLEKWEKWDRQNKLYADVHALVNEVYAESGSNSRPCRSVC